MDTDSDSGVYSEKWIRQQLQWPLTRGNKGNKISKNNIEVVSKDIKTKPDNLVSINISSSSDEDYEIDEEVRIIFIQESAQVIRYPILPSAPFTSIFERISKFKNVNVDQIELVMIPENRCISQYDSLKSLNFNPCSMFHVYIKDHGKSIGCSNEIGNIEVKCIMPNKSVMKYKVMDKQPLDILSNYCSRDLKVERHKFKLLFDGEIIKPSDTCSSLDIASHDLIEIHFIP